MRNTDSTPAAGNPPPKASTAKSLPEKYTCKPCNKTVLLSNKSAHEASRRHTNAPITCTLCNVSYGGRCHEGHIVGKKHLANLNQDQDLAPGVSWDRPTEKKQLGNGVAPRRLGDGIRVIRLVASTTGPSPQATNPVLWRCGVCTMSMAVGLRASHQHGQCVPAPLKTRGNPIRAQVNADKRAEAKKREREESIRSAREGKGDGGVSWWRGEREKKGDRSWWMEDDYMYY